MKRYEDKSWADSMRLRVDFNNMMCEFIGEEGIHASEIYKMQEAVVSAEERMKNKRGSMRWRDLPKTQQETVLQIKQTAQYVRENFDAFVVLGIGGSALGPIAVHQALAHTKYNELSDKKRGGPKFYVEDNVDPEKIAALLDVIDIKKTVFNIITKSGNTSETIAQMLLFIDKLKKEVGDDWTKHIIATTDENNGSLREITKRYDLTTFFVPEGVGGRFSELSPVGLLSAAVCGIDIEELLAGAAYMDDICSRTSDVWNNPAYISAVLEVMAMKKGCNISVLMPYADSLKYMSDWYAQLWAESLGKRYNSNGEEVHTGQTPVKALGVTDQHSQIQLYAEGPNDKVVTFMRVNNYRKEIIIPHVEMFGDLPHINFLSGHSFNELISFEEFSTEYALVKSNRMNKTIVLEEVNPFTIGQLICLFELQTAFAGELLNINAFDQPGVEEGKKATYALLNRPGYDEKRKELESMPEKNEQYIA
ncbi:MAG: glucose-6-phosphate isomerase [Clostridia bacterium]|nr:glucose-6-phosphate isomerase [Clostridia bacterium]